MKSHQVGFANVMCALAMSALLASVPVLVSAQEFGSEYFEGDLGGSTKDSWGTEYFAPDESWGTEYFAPEENWGTEYFAPDENWGTEYFTPEENWGTEYFAPEPSWGTEYFSPDSSWGTEYFAPDYSPSYTSSCGGCRYSSSSGGHSSGGGWSAPAPRSTGGGYSYSSPISVSSGRSYAQPVTYTHPSTPVVVSGGGGTTHNNNNNTNNNQNINNINVSATAIAMAPIATPVAAYIPPAPVHPAPYCTITITNQYGLGYGYGQQTVTWNSMNAHSASINPVIGSVSTNGSRIVSNMGGTVYTMTVWGPGGSATCQTQPMYAPVPVPATPHVALSQIPYTGFDYGPVGNAMYWVSLALVAAAGAYLMVYYNGGMLAFAGSMIGRGNEARSSRLAEFTPLPESAFAPAKKTVARLDTKVGYTGTFDTMSITRSENGAPKIVINRA